ncbi:MAG: DsbE family thiol:disulfide interchange protein [Chromatiales bacterium]|jgi:cytochrome c biogenesis protein CcmG/thiol:disulfide interchange protein DsbE|nr:MAG: DsbE family thiol:disulfide interchange protein [Chromatiales bacterium]
MQRVLNTLKKLKIGSRTGAGLGLVVMVLAMLIYGFQGLAGISAPRLPEFTLQRVSDPQLEVTTESLFSRPALVNVWASWCVACRAEHDFLIELGKTGETPLFGLNHQDNREDAKRWLTYFGDPYRFSVYDKDGAVGKAMQVQVLPVTFLIGDQNEILARHVGPLEPDSYARVFVPLLEAARENRK